MSVSGGRNDTIMNNTFANNNSWAVVFLPYPDNGPPCTGGTPGGLGPGSCLYDDWGDALIGNTFSHNGSYGHPSNGDFAWLSFENGHPTPCFSVNAESGGGTLTPDALKLQQTYPSCNGQSIPSGSSNQNFLPEVLCNTQVELSPGTPSPCPTGQYPRRTQVVMHPLPRGLQTMRNPCAGVPANPWCTRRR
jgi:hypothetical protein